MEHLQEVHNRLARIEDKIDTLNEFRTATVVATRFYAVVVSGLCGVITMIATSLINYYTLLKTK